MTTQICTGCGGSDATSLFGACSFDGGIDQYELMRCSNCFLVRTQPLLPDDQLARYYTPAYYGNGPRGKFGPLVELAIRLCTYRRARALVRRASNRHAHSGDGPLRVLDIGCGRASLLRFLDKLGCECHGTERVDFPLPEGSGPIRFHPAAVEAMPFDGEYFDLVVMWHVLEHLGDPAATLHEVPRIMKPGGTLALAVPNFDSLQRRLFGRNWFHLDLPRHTHHFGLQSLRDHLARSGFRVCSVSTFSLEQNPYGFVQSCLNAFASSHPPNTLYSLLHAPRGSSSAARLLSWAVPAVVLLPLGLSEYLFSGLAGVGATLVVYAERLKS